MLENAIDVINQRLDRIERKIDKGQENCVGCSKAFGILTEKVDDLDKDFAEHKVDHKDNKEDIKWKYAYGVSVFAVIVSILSVIWNALKH